MALAVGAVLSVVVTPAQAGTVKDFTGASSARLNAAPTANYTPGGFPTNVTDLRLTSTALALDIDGANGAVTVESLNVANGSSYNITARSGTNVATLNLGNPTAFTNAFSSTDNDLIYLTGNSTLSLFNSTGTGAKILNVVLASSGNFDVVTGSNLSISSVISGSGFGFTKTGGGLATIQNTANTYTGPTAVSAGTLRLAVITGQTGVASIASSSGTSVIGGTLEGNGVVSSLSVSGSGNISPGTTLNIGTLTAANTTFDTGSNYLFQILSTTTAPGIGTDLLTLNTGNVLTLGSGPITLKLQSLSSAGTAGDVSNFDGSSNYSFTLATTDQPIVGFNAANLLINTSDFTNAAGGTFTPVLSQDGTDLLVTYTAPEPSTGILLLTGVAAAGFRRRRTSRS